MSLKAKALNTPTSIDVMGSDAKKAKKTVLIEYAVMFFASKCRGKLITDESMLNIQDFQEFFREWMIVVKSSLFGIMLDSLHGVNVKWCVNKS